MFFVLVDVSSSYTWNSVSISGTNMLRGIPVICRELYSPTGVNLSTLPQMTQNDDLSMLD